jgi:hypothetical protein
MNILYFMRHHGYLRNFESTIRLLLDRGHAVRVVFDREKPVPQAERLRADYAAFSYEFTLAERRDPWFYIARDFRNTGDYLRFLQPLYRDCLKLRERVETRAPLKWVRLLRMRWMRARAARRMLFDLLGIMERATPSSRALEDLIQSRHPDVVLVTPLVDVQSPQVDVVKSAKALGLPVGLCVNSWDNLTNKGLIWEMPDRVFVWNGYQEREAIGLHGVPTDRVVVTGAQAYDHWFRWRPSVSREEFCARVGLDPARPYFLYVCSSAFIAPHERPFVERWIGAIRGCDDPEVRSAGILIRPHAGNAIQWDGFDPSVYPDVTINPRAGASPIDERSKSEYFDAIYYAAAVIGVNTSAMIEAGIVGRQVHTILAPEFAEGQLGTLHFRYLLRANGGLVHAAKDLDEHLSNLGATTRDPDSGQERNRRFVDAFVRPHGPDTSGTPLLADEIERLAMVDTARRRGTPVTLLPVRLALRSGLIFGRQLIVSKTRRRVGRLRARCERGGRRLGRRVRRAVSPRVAVRADRNGTSPYAPSERDGILVDV